MAAAGQPEENALQEQMVDGHSTAWYRRAVLSMSFSFFLIFAGFNAAQGMQSSLNGELGYINMAALYVTFALICIVVPAFLHRLEDRGKSTLRLLPTCGFVYAAMVLVNIHPVPAEGAPGYKATAVIDIFCSFLVGLAAPVLWTIQGVYVGRCALKAARCSDQGSLGGDVASRMISAYMGLFNSIYQFAGVVGTATTSAVLILDENGTARTALFVLLGAITLAGALSTLTVPKVSATPSLITPCRERSRSAVEEGETDNQCSRTIVLVLKSKKMSLLVPLILANGMFLGFIFSNYADAFVSATIGPTFAGLALMIFYGANSVSSVAWGWLIQSGRVQVWGAMVSAFVLQMVVLLLLLVASLGYGPLFRVHYDFSPGQADVRKAWVVNSNGLPQWWEFLAPLGSVAVAAVGSAVYESQIPATLQGFFRDERAMPAMANWKLWQSVGFAVSFLMGAVVTRIAARVGVLVFLFIASFVALASLHYGVKRLP